MDSKQIQTFPLLLIVSVLHFGCGRSGFLLTEESHHLRQKTSENSIEVLRAVLPKSSDPIQTLCARSGSDKVRQVFCGTTRPQISNMVELQKAMGLDFSNPIKPKVAMLASTTSLLTKSVSSINPVAFVFSDAKPDFVIMSFARGEPMVEIAVGDPVSNEKRFYLGVFSQACDLNNSCVNADRYTPAIENNWKSFTLYEDEDLKNTILDCRQCHAGHRKEGRNGQASLAQNSLRMQELVRPWTHWMGVQSSGGSQLLNDFHAMHGTNESYGGIPSNVIDQSNPAALEALVRVLGDGIQPNAFDSEVIEQEMSISSGSQDLNFGLPATGIRPADEINQLSGGPFDLRLTSLVKSQTWRSLFSGFVGGSSIPVPYPGTRATSPSKISTMTTAYLAVKAGTTTQLPDLQDVFSDDPDQLSILGHKIFEDLSAQQTLTNACGHCHNSGLDQTISRAKFNVQWSGNFNSTVASFSTAEAQEAIRRINLPVNDPRVMPPVRFRTLSSSQKNKLSQYLSNTATANSGTNNQNQTTSKGE